MECASCKKYQAELRQAIADIDGMADELELLEFIKSNDPDYYKQAVAAFKKGKKR